ncbi:unnamed protein product [Mytilus edulis]|uniref:Uncharacterized protein n=1 Tax=Mytilus edulis TaxID=6550 RepID=A0A8S3V430_MYTED|nr:unnamed protein product [Mytilus edulis]
MDCHWNIFTGCSDTENRHDKLIQYFFQTIEDVKLEHYVCLINGLTSYGRNSDLVLFHPKLCKEILVHSGLTVFNLFCRPIGWISNCTNFVEVSTDLLMKKLYSMITFCELNENGQEFKENNMKHYRYLSTSELANGRYVVGHYVFEILIKKGVDTTCTIAKTLFTHLKNNAKTINPKCLKEFLDGLLDDGNRSSIVSQFKEFFEAVLFKYGSIPIVLQLCRPLTTSVSSPNIIYVDAKLLAGKLSAYLESAGGKGAKLKLLSSIEERDNGSYFVHWDDNYFESKSIEAIAKFIAEHGVNFNNDKFVRLMYEQLVSNKEEHSDGEESEYDKSESTSDDARNVDEDGEHSLINSEKIVFDDYQGMNLEG